MSTNDQGQLDWDSLEIDPRSDVQASWVGAVLLSDEIKYYAERKDYPLIHPFVEANLKPARYHLTLGPEAIIAGRYQEVGPDKPLIIAPHQVAIVRTNEVLNIPRFLIGRWNLRVDMVYKGLLWVGALQVDPGWVGYLPCPLYNLSDAEVQIDFKEKLFTIDFVRTTPFRKGSSIPYTNEHFKPNPPLKTFDPFHLKSGPYESLHRLEELVTFRDFVGFVLVIIVAVLAAIVGGLAISAWEIPRKATAVLSVVSLLFSAFALLVGLAGRRRKRGRV